MASDYSVYSTFDIDQHKQVFINYLEVIINPDGTVEYAVPSHTEKIIRILTASGKFASREEVIQSCDISECYISALVNLSGCVAVWNDFAVFPVTATRKQWLKLKELKLHKLYRGRLAV